MRHFLKNPWWVDLPEIACGVAVAWAAAAADLPERVAMQFDFSGSPTRWGPWWEAYAGVLAPSALVLAVALLLSELWARQETIRRFNWIAVVFSGVLALEASLAVYYFRSAGVAAPSMRVSWIVVAGATLACMALRLALERLRPFRSERRAEPEEDVAKLREALRARAASGVWAYWEEQNPRWLNGLVLVGGVFLLAGAVAAWLTGPLWVAVLTAALAAMPFVFYGGMQVVVTRERLKVGVGLLGLRFFSRPIAEIVSAETMEFSPLADFGGWGPGRYSLRLKMWGFFLGGRRGVRVQMRNGKRYLIGSDHPDRLAAVVAEAIAKT
jgi:hypothetical protein